MAVDGRALASALRARASASRSGPEGDDASRRRTCSRSPRRAPRSQAASEALGLDRLGQLKEVILGEQAALEALGLLFGEVPRR